MSYICINDNIVYYRKGLGVWRGKIIDFYNYNGLRVKCLFNNDIILTFSAKSLVKTESFWWVSID